MTISRRNFLGGAALLAVSPAVVAGLDLSGDKAIEIGSMDQIRALERTGPLGTSEIRAALVARINCHWHLFGEPPKILFLSAQEAASYEKSLLPVQRYSVTNVSNAGYKNLLFKNIPVASVDHQLMVPEERFV